MKALIVRNGLLGDIILATSVIRPLKNAGYAQLDWLSDRRMLEIRDWIPECGHVHVLNQKLGIPLQFSLIGQLREQHYDLCIILEQSSRYYPLVWIAGAKKTASFHRSSLFGLGVDHKRLIEKSKTYFWNFNQLLGDFIPDVDNSNRPCLAAPENWQTPRFMEWSKTCHPHSLQIVIHPGSSQVTWKSWPVKHYKELVSILLAKQEDLQIVLSGTGSELDPFKEWTKTFLDDRVLLFNDFNMSEFFGLIQSSSLFISSDTGPMHVAGALRKNQIAFFGPTDPSEVGPGNDKAVLLSAKDTCRFCDSDPGAIGLKHECLDSGMAKCLEQIEPQSVVDEIQRKWGSSSSILLKEKLTG